MHAAMVNYYDILKVSPEATAAEIKSAYRRLARKLHPDANQGNEETALKFAAIAEAYEVLGNARERDRYNQRLGEMTLSGSDTVLTSSNRHAQRWRQMVYEKRYNDIIDRLMEEERLENLAFQRAVFPFVSLLITSVLATAAKPQIFVNTGVIGKIIIVALFIAGIIHIIGRVKDGFVRYTEEDIHESILDGQERPSRPMSQVGAAGVVIGSILACLGIGSLIGMLVDFPAQVLPSMFSTKFEPEFFLYPPIVTFFVDVMHSIVSRFER
ncbi:MAG TPA: J domain-containing protein [Pyrinomonadaceae bacterium]|nr:J domain-containing protein [Pyrinomonadaceae bacterium]